MTSSGDSRSEGPMEASRQHAGGRSKPSVVRCCKARDLSVSSSWTGPSETFRAATWSGDRPLIAGACTVGASLARSSSSSSSCSVIEWIDATYPPSRTDVTTG
jgi:hypothetical protein